MKLPILLLFFLASCFRETASVSDDSVHTLSPSKQKQKIGLLVKKLENAERERKKIQSEVEKLSGEIHQAKLVLIRKQLDESEKQIQDLHANPQKYPHLLTAEIGSLFAQEREALHLIIQDGPSPWAFDAQVELDRILRMITELSETRSGHD